jgi:hypothetical protein
MPGLPTPMADSCVQKMVVQPASKVGRDAVGQKPYVPANMKEYLRLWKGENTKEISALDSTDRICHHICRAGFTSVGAPRKYKCGGPFH